MIEAGKVFVSSTCYDLLDLRAELEAEIRALGLTPIMSDRHATEFEVLPDKNSIETCLANVRAADLVIVILSQRYGPTLNSIGYQQISATHLEYRVAVEANKPIYFYVRDRLEADYNVWRKNTAIELSFAWAKKDASSLFGFIDEHKSLTKDKPNSNWLWVFRDTCDLKARLRIDMKAKAGVATIRRLMEIGQIACLIPEVSGGSIAHESRQLMLNLQATNVGTAAAIQPFISLSSTIGETVRRTKTLLPGESTSVSLMITVTDDEIQRGDCGLGIECSYTAPQGHYVTDVSSVELSWDPFPSDEIRVSNCEYFGKRYHHSNAIKVEDSKN